MNLLRVCAALLVCGLIACGDDDGGEDAGPVDAASMDSASMDSGGEDGGDADGGGDDSGIDGGGLDGGDVDSGGLDGGGLDSGGPDAGAGPDGGFEDAMSFFVSSSPVFDTVGSAATGDISGDGNLIFTVPDTSPPVVLRGVEAADAHCAALAAAAGAVRPNWVAYLSTHGLPEAGDPGTNGPQIDARDRIGAGPWFNADGDVITDAGGTVLTNATIHAEIGVVLGQGRDADAPANVAAVTAYNLARPDETLILDESGVAIPLNAHDIFTGSDDDGTVYDGGYPERWFTGDRTPPAGERTQWGTCNDWDYSRFGNAPGTEFAQTGHTDIPGGGFSPSWNSAHDTADCSVSGVQARGGRGHVYCFSPD